MNNSSKTISIIGGGFSGTLLAVNLVNNSKEQLNINIIDASGEFAKGVAYSTDFAGHLLNVTADKMGAFPDRIDDFYNWVIGNKNIWQKYDDLKDLEVSANSFLPRKLYGIYIENLLRKSEEKNAINKIKARALDIEEANGKLKVKLDNGEEILSDKVALTVGNFPSKKFKFENDLRNNKRYIPTMWDKSGDNFLNRKDLSDVTGSVLMIGTGLTMVDAVISLEQKGFKGEIIAVSRNGKMPQPHKLYEKAYSNFINNDEKFTCESLTKKLRNEINDALRHGYDWRAVIDAARPSIVPVWKKLDISEKEKVMNNLFLWWNIHRHRVPTGSHQTIKQLKAGDKLHVIAASIEDVKDNNGELEVTINKKGTKQNIKAAYVINCTGPELDIERSGSELLVNMYKKGLIKKGNLNMGIKPIESDRLFAFGPIMFGEYLETTAVPELRGQAAETAMEILRR